MEERFEIFPIKINTPEEISRIIAKQLVIAGTQGSNPRYQPLVNTIKHASSLDPQCIILQRNVQDPDFLAEHAAYYARWTAKVSRYCNRFHFFKAFPRSNDILDVIDQMATEPDTYLGFITLRPISVSPVAASILKPLSNVQDHFILSKDSFQVNLAGQCFNINGTPFMQQDNAVGACAQASIWMGLRTLRKKEGRAAFSPSQITTAATRFLVQGRTLPNRAGLSLEQISEAIRAAGYSTNVISLRDPRISATPESIQAAKMKLYPYVESGIPVLIALYPQSTSGHAVLLIGHGWNSTPTIRHELDQFNNSFWQQPIKVIDASTWVEPFYIHNDNTGPYLPLDGTSNTTYCLADAVSAIPFLPSDVFIDAAEAQFTCLKLLKNALSDFSPTNTKGTAPAKYTIEDIVVRLYLLDRSQFRTNVLKNTMSIDVKNYYRLKWLPKRIWIMELNALTGYETAPDGTGVRLGEILLDPASEPEDGAFLSIHLSAKLLPPQFGTGVIINRDALTGEISAQPVSAGVYTPLIRPPA